VQDGELIGCVGLALNVNIATGCYGPNDKPLLETPEDHLQPSAFNYNSASVKLLGMNAIGILCFGDSLTWGWVGPSSARALTHTQTLSFPLWRSACRPRQCRLISKALLALKWSARPVVLSQRWIYSVGVLPLRILHTASNYFLVLGRPRLLGRVKVYRQMGFIPV